MLDVHHLATIHPVEADRTIRAAVADDLRRYVDSLADVGLEDLPAASDMRRAVTNLDAQIRRQA